MRRDPDPVSFGDRWVALFGLLAVVAAAAVAGQPAAAGDEGSPSLDHRSPPPGLADGAPTGDPDYLIGPDDGLWITVVGMPEASRLVRVRPDGYIGFPVAGEVRASGRTATAVQEELAHSLAGSVLDPQVTVDVVEAGGFGRRSIRVIGAAVTPKSIPFRAGMRVVDALLAVGGLSPTADGNSALLVTADTPSAGTPLRLDDLVEKRDVSADVMLKPGDVIVIPEGFFAGQWDRRFSLAVSQAFTDNVRLAPSGDEKAALVTSLTPALDISGKGARISGALSAAVTGGYVSLSDTGFNFIPNVLGGAKTELVRDKVYVDAATLVNKQALNATTETSSVASLADNLTLVQTYQVSPYLVSRIKDFAYVETRYNVAGTVTGANANRSSSGGGNSETLSDSVTNGLQVRLATPPEKQSRLDWQAIGYGRQTIRFGTSDVLEGGARFAPSVAITRTLALLTSAGYSFLDVGDVRLTGPEAAAGVRYEPSAALSLHALGGWRLENPEVDALFRYDPAPATRLSASYTDSVSVGQTLLISTLGRLTYDPETRQFVDDRTALAYSSSNSGYSLENGLTRTQQAALGLAQTYSVNTFSFRGYFTKQELVDGGGVADTGASGLASSQTSWGVTAGWQRSLPPRTTAQTAIGFAYTDEGRTALASDSDNAPSGTLKDVRFQIGLVREIADATSAHLTYYYQRRFADSAADEFTENAVIIGLTRRF